MQSEDGCLPLDGVRVLDLTAFWAGPSATQYLATLGADVIKVESIQRPDSMRFNVSVSPKTERWWEQGYLFLSANLNKRGITLNLGDDRGRQLFLQLAAQSDVVVENFTPRVMENFELTYDVIREVRPDVVMVSMPGWGLEGPWRDRPGFATTMEQASGMAFVTGYDDGPPMAPGLCDPLAGVHGAFAVLAALEERRKTGRGQHVEVPMIDLAVNVSAEQILEFEAYGELMTRTGNRCLQAAPQGVYACAGADEWLALSVTTEEQWKALCEAIGAQSWAADPELATVDQRYAAHDRIDAEIGAWCAHQALSAALDALGAAGAQPVVPAYAIDEDRQMQARGFWEPVIHPVVGEHRYPGMADAPLGRSGGLVPIAGAAPRAAQRGGAHRFARPRGRRDRRSARGGRDRRTSARPLSSRTETMLSGEGSDDDDSGRGLGTCTDARPVLHRRRVGSPILDCEDRSDRPQHRGGLPSCRGCAATRHGTGRRGSPRSLRPRAMAANDSYRARPVPARDRRADCANRPRTSDRCGHVNPVPSIQLHASAD